MLEQQEQPIQKIGDYLKMYRERAQLSREELSLRTDYSHSHIYSVERGTSKPTMQYIEIVSPHLNIKMPELFSIYKKNDLAKAYNRAQVSKYPNMKTIPIPVAVAKPITIASVLNDLDAIMVIASKKLQGETVDC